MISIVQLAKDRATQTRCEYNGYKDAIHEVLSETQFCRLVYGRTVGIWRLLFTERSINMQMR